MRTFFALLVLIPINIFFWNCESFLRILTTFVLLISIYLVVRAWFADFNKSATDAEVDDIAHKINMYVIAGIMFVPLIIAPIYLILKSIFSN